MDDRVYIIPLPRMSDADLDALWERLLTLWPRVESRGGFKSFVRCQLEDEEPFDVALRVDPQSSCQVWSTGSTSFYMYGGWCRVSRITKLSLEDLESYNDN